MNLCHHRQICICLVFFVLMFSLHISTYAVAANNSAKVICSNSQYESSKSRVTRFLCNTNTEVTKNKFYKRS
jgi:hypothetical protein